MQPSLNPIALLEKHYAPGSKSHHILLQHSEQVATKAVAIAINLALGTAAVSFIREAALLHDIGILYTAVPQLGCQGDLPYLCHGIKGREILEAEGLPLHALVCERHIGVGLSAKEILRQQLPLPVRNMLPISLEEQIVTYADLFFSKNPAKLGLERSADKVRKSLTRHGEDKVAVFDEWHARFGS
ncbi:MAG: phosphohydrolase [Desulfuromonadales bacterium C00003094]|nr:MAG: phosphohydrolase [Desulfuromonadales bacterium C00003094]OEU73890.1 MAG: phosphohydrolase [Desulfuromonadales bacterium C00003107]